MPSQGSVNVLLRSLVRSPPSIAHTDFGVKVSHHELRTLDKRHSASQDILTSPNRHSHNRNIYLKLSSIKATPSERLAWRPPNITVV